MKGRTFVPALVCAVLTVAATPAAVAAQQLTLADAVAAALEGHPALAAAAARAEAIDGSADAARASRLPSLSATATLVRFEEPMVVAPLHSFDPQNPPRFEDALLQGQLGAEYAVLDLARPARIRAADALVEAAHLERTATEQDVIERTISAYLTVLSSRALLDAAEAQAEALEAERTRVKQNVGAGTAPEVDLLRASATLQQAVAERASAAAMVGLAERRLARVATLPNDRVRGAALADVAAERSAEPIVAASSPRIARAERSVTAAEAGLAQERAGRLPRLSASASLQEFGTPEGASAWEWQAGLRFSWPVFSGGATRAQIRRAEAELDAARAERAATALTIADELDAARTALAEAEARHVALRTAVAQWEEVARIARLALDAGSGVQRDLLEAEAGLFRARAGEAEARYDAVLALVAEARALGTLDTAWIRTTLEAGG